MTTWVKPTGPQITGDVRPVSFTTSGSPPARVEPITLAETKLALKVGPSTTEDSLFSIWIAAARQKFERLADRQTINAIQEYALDAVPAWPVIEIPRPPLINVESVVYDDGDGVETTLAASTYIVHKSGIFDGSPSSGVLDPYCTSGSIELRSGSTWPATSGLKRSFRIRFTCGYGETAAEIPLGIKAILFMLVGHYWRNRHEVTEKNLQTVPLGFQEALLEYQAASLRNEPLRTA